MADERWDAVIGKSLAFLCLTQGDLRGEDLATQGQFLESLGLMRSEAAALLGTTPASLSELIRQANKKRKGKKNGRKKA